MGIFKTKGKRNLRKICKVAFRPTIVLKKQTAIIIIKGNHMRHVFRATLIGWDKEQDFVWFDSNQYTKEEAEAQFKPYQGITQKGYPYTGYEFDGQKYHDFYYLGEYEDDDMPKSNLDYVDRLINKMKSSK